MEAHGAGANARTLGRERRVVALVAARNEAGRIGPCVRALRSLAGEVVVVDDGSGDATAAEASEAGATVLRTGRRTGKGGALEGALRRLGAADLWLLADGDLGATASNLTPLLEAVTSGEADLAIAVLPPARAGGFGIVKRFAAHLIRGQTGFRASEPLSGQRALTSQAMQAVRPLAARVRGRDRDDDRRGPRGCTRGRDPDRGARAPPHVPDPPRVPPPRPAGLGHREGGPALADRPMTRSDARR